jgi:glycosyltransferase involved in cell wall biosynthesis
MMNPGRSRISVLLITLNEERLLDTVLRSVAWADEIIVLDSGSTDATAEIARRYTTGFHVNPYLGEGDQRRHSLDLSTGDWILYVDGDEVVSPRLRRSIEEAVANPGRNAGFRVQLHTRFLGRWFGTRGWRKEWKIRLFRRDAGHFSPVPVHSGAVVDGPIGTLRGPLLHFPYLDIGHLVTKLNRYSSGLARDMGERGRTTGPVGSVARGVARFLRDFILGGDFLYGGAGLVRSALNGYYAFLKYAKLWESSISDQGEPKSPLLPPEENRA